LVELIDDEDIARRATFPENAEIREIACHLAAKVFEQALQEGLKVGLKCGRTQQYFTCDTCQGPNPLMVEAYQHGGLAELKTYIYSKMWYPNYRPLVFQGRGGE
jgi:hypothetical protein